ncbi:hypothetical protein H9647_01610 [Paenibacillus sp. Sa2BVA9]|uniref:Uncharacterized protein n=2 Tax=Paenibacillus gallinarum TaxID=2762232 RepID=A0ABR8SUE6_9BACL|nr:hypothetical protein [Paenibacillus gallinarum]
MMSHRIKRKKYFCIFAIVISCTVATFYYHRDLPFHHNIEAVIYSPDMTFEKKTTVTLDGEKYKRLSGKHRISGEIRVDEELSYHFTADLDGNQYVYMIPYYDESGNQRTLGVIHISKDLDQVWLSSSELNSRYQLDDGYVYGPASSKRDVGNSLTKMLYGE